MYHTYEESWIIGGGPEAKGYPRRRSRRLTKEAQGYANSDFGVSVNWGRDGDGTSMNEESDVSLYYLLESGMSSALLVKMITKFSH